MTQPLVSVKRLLPAELGRVFEAWSSAELMSRWFVVDPSWTVKATNDFRVGGKYRVEMRRDDGTVFVAFGEYVEISAPRRLVFTWSSALPAIDRSLVTIELAPPPAGGKCSVSPMRTATTTPEASVRAATIQIAAWRPNRSALTPESRAPAAYPRSRHNR